MWIVYIAVGMIIIAFLAVFVVIVYLWKKQKVSQTFDVEYGRGEILGSMHQQHRSYTITDPHHLGCSQQSVDVHFDTGEYRCLNVSKKQFYQFIKGMYGDITYKGNRLLTFERLLGHENLHQQQFNEQHPEYVGDLNADVYVYCDMPSVGLIVPTTEMYKVNQEQAIKLVHKLVECTTDSFIGFDNETTIIQFVKDQGTTSYLLDVPLPKNGGSHQAILSSMKDIETILVRFYNNEDVLEGIETSWVTY